MRSPWRESPRRRAAWFALIVAVLVGHLVFGVKVVSSVIGWNASDEPRRIEVSLVRQLAPTAPPVVADEAPVPAAVPRGARTVRAPRVARAASAPASAPASASSRDELVAQALALATAQAASAPAGDASAPLASAAAASTPASAASADVAGAAASGPARPPFEWPPSTRLTYTLTGQRNGANLYGNAAVEWRRDGTHYQVQFDIHITPMIEQHMQSDGQIGPDGLSPGRYDETFTMPLITPRVRKVEFGADEVTLSNGQQVPKLPQTQDGASQFVQFVWMFATHPSWLKTGNMIDIPLALTHSLHRWRYLVLGTERLQLPFGAIDAIHLKPILDGPRKANEYPFEIWTAPTLQYMPVRVLVKTDVNTYADLSLDNLPLQAGETAPVRVVPPPPLPVQPNFGER